MWIDRRASMLRVDESHAGEPLVLRRQPVAALLILLLVAACAGAATSPSLSVSGSPVASLPSPMMSPSVLPTATQMPSPTRNPVTPSPTLRRSPSPTPAGSMIVRAYFLLKDTRGEDPALVPVLRTVPRTTAVATAAMGALLTGPSVKERAAVPAIESFVPAGTKLLEIDIADQRATVDLSGEFASLTPESAWDLGSFELRARLAQVTYTLTQFTTIDRVSFRLDGKPVESFSAMPDPDTGSSEAIVVDKPVTRATYRDRFLPPIFVDRPAWGATVSTPARVTGLTSVFEAQFRMALIDRRGKVLVDVPVRAAGGTGAWSPFDVTLPYKVSTSQWGTLRVWDFSEADGNAIAVREYPLYLRAAP